MEGQNRDIATAVSDIQLILAEKRTSLALIRTEIAVLALPLFLIIFGQYHISHALKRLRHYDVLILQIKSRYKDLAEFVD